MTELSHSSDISPDGASPFGPTLTLGNADPNDDTR
jgi:hypothetical protein